MNYHEDNRIVLTLDAGGTNFVFSAICGNEEIAGPLTLPSNGDDLKRCLQTIEEGFSSIREEISGEPVAISFAFPGPADYPRGIIMDLQNLPGFRGGVPLGPILQDKFGIPVFINNDGNLFAYGEALSGFLPYLNKLLEEHGSPKRYHNLAAFTLGTGFGGGIVIDGRLVIGDNSNAGEVWLLRNRVTPQLNAEEGISIRALRAVYAGEAGIPLAEAPSPEGIYHIAAGKKDGNRSAAETAYCTMAKVLGDALATVLTIIDGVVVLGGGIANAHPFFLKHVIGEMNGSFEFPDGKKMPRLVTRVFNLENKEDMEAFLQGEASETAIPSGGRRILYDPMMRTGVAVTRIGTSRAIALGAYAFALNALDR